MQLSEEIVKPAKRGRTVSCTEEVTNRFCEAINLGMPRGSACQYAGISESALYDWIEKGKECITPYKQFLERLEEAESGAKAKWLAYIEKAMQGYWEEVPQLDRQGNPVLDENGNPKMTKRAIVPPSWAAAAWKLERRYPKDFGRAPMIAQQINAGGDVSMQVNDPSNLSDAELKKQIAELQAKLDEK